MYIIKENSFEYYFIYMIKNMINKKCYVGFHATNKEYDEDNYFGSGDLLKPAIIKYGIENFVMGIIEYIDPNEWQEKEKYWVKEMKSHVSQWGYNQTEGGDGILGFKHTRESKDKMSEKKKGKPSNRIGLKHTEKAKEKNRQAHLGKIASEKTIKKNRKAHLGEKNGMSGKNHSIKTIELFRKQRKGKKPWNKGLSKETDERVKKYGESNSKSV